MNRAIRREIYCNLKNKRLRKVSDTAYLRKKYALLSKSKKREFTVLKEAPVCEDNMDTSLSIFLSDFKFKFSEFKEMKKRKTVNGED